MVSLNNLTEVDTAVDQALDTVRALAPSREDTADPALVRAAMATEVTK